MSQKLLIVPIYSITDVDIDSDNYMKRLVSLGLCFTISLILVLGTVFSFSPFTIPNNAFADDTMGGTMGGDNGGGDNEGNNMPPPEDAPATTDALTAGGGSDNDDDDDNNSDDIGGSRDDGNNNDKDKDNGKDNEPQSKDAPVTTNTITAIECPEGQEVALFSTSCEPARADSQDSSTAATNPSVTEYKPPPSVLPYKGDEVKLIERYDRYDYSDVKSDITGKGEGNKLVFKDGTVRIAIGDSDRDYRGAKEMSMGRVHYKIIPGSNTPLDRLGVTQVDLPTVDVSSEKHLVPRNSKAGTGGTFLHKVQYNDGSSIIASKNENGDQGFWDVYDSNGQLKSTTMADPATKTTAIENKQDNSVTFHPQGANSYTVYPRAADGTQKTVTVTSEGQPVVTVRDANGNVIPPKE